jgi:RNA polymerase sigma-70 factor (ECF subfamily)
MPGLDNRTDEQLVDACNAGDVAAFEELYRRYKEWAVGVAYRFTGDRDAALDVMQEAFAYLLTRFPGFRLSARLTSFLYVVIKHRALSAKRRERRAPLQRGDTAERHAVPSEAEWPPVNPEAAGVLTGAIRALPDAQREVLLMRAVDGMGLQEIAVALSIPVGTVKSRLHHALAALRANPATVRYFDADTPFSRPV